MEHDKKEIVLSLDEGELRGILTYPKNAKCIVIFAHGSGSGRLSPRNQYVSNVLVKNGIATLLIDLLTMKEEEIDELTRQFRFDIPILAERLIKASSWTRKQEDLKKLKIGYFGASTGAAAALIAAANPNSNIGAVVSRGGRPDLANEVLAQVTTPTLLIVGGADFGVIELNEQAYALLGGEKKLEIVPNATHLFEEPGTLELASEHATKWFLKYLKN